MEYIRNITDSSLFAIVYPLLSIFFGIYIIKYVLKPKLHLSKVFTYNSDRNNEIHYKLYNSSFFFNAIEVRTKAQITYTDNARSRVYKKNIIENQQSLSIIPKNRIIRVKAQGEVYYSSDKSSWIRGIDLEKLKADIDSIEGLNNNSNIELLIIVIYKSELTGIQHTFNKKFKLHDISNWYGSENKLLNAITKSGYFKIGLTDVIPTSEERSFEIIIMDKLNDKGKSKRKRIKSAKIYIYKNKPVKYKG